MRSSVAWWIVISICIAAGPGWMHGQELQLESVTAPVGEPEAPSAQTASVPDWNARGPDPSPK